MNFNKGISNYKHGMWNTKIYYVWTAMKARCSNPNVESYPDYGGRGITVEDPRWLEFINFYNDMKDTYQEHLSIDRIDNDKGYFKENCRWTTKDIQANNRRISYNETVKRMLIRTNQLDLLKEYI